MKTILLDTNILMSVFQLKIDIFSELERVCDFPYNVAILDKTVDELHKIQLEQKGKHKSAAKAAISLIAKAKIPKIKAHTSVDDTLADLSAKGYIVATVDSALKKRLTPPYVIIRKKKYLILVNG